MSNNATNTEIIWDVAIVGTGVGGSTLGWALARQGLSVLFLEKGKAVGADRQQTQSIAPKDRLAEGWWPNPVTWRREDGKRERFQAPVGCAFGGSSIHYAAALERLEPSDFDPLTTMHGELPAWPAAYANFLPFYEAAEALYRLPPKGQAGAEDRFSEWDRGLMAAMRANGMRPEPLRVAMAYDAQCRECVGVVCPRRCKADARTACLEEALTHERCEILDNCDVQTLDADGSCVRSIRALRHGQSIEVRAKVVVLAAGALHSPQILLRSRSELWPQGLANGSDQVGRNLMFHTSDLYTLWAPRRLNREGRQKKSISIRDFYAHEGRRLGYVQSMGLDAGRGHIAVFLKDQLRRWGITNELLLAVIVKVPSHVVAAALGKASVFAAMTEDDPDPNNRIELDPNEPDGAVFTYSITTDLRQRADGLRKAFAKQIGPWRLMRLSPTLQMNFGHPCGTCRFGTDPAKSVLDVNNRAHELSNLFVVDSSFMPRSGAVNPSLTIAANALRVAPAVASACAEFTG